MDMSLDDYLKKKNPSSHGRSIGNRIGRGGSRRPQVDSIGFKKPLGVKRGGISPKASVLSRLGNKGRRSKPDENSSRQGFQIKQLAMDKEKPSVPGGNLKIVVEDARQKIGMKGGLQDARVKLSNKSKLGIGDARNKLKRKQTTSDKIVTIGRPNVETDISFTQEVGDENPYTWKKTISNPNVSKSQIDTRGRLGLTRVVNQSPPPEIVQPFNDKTDLTIVRNFRPSLATFTVGGDDSFEQDADESRFNVRVTRQVPKSEPVFTLPDYSDLLKDTERKLQAGHGDLYYGKMQADRESSGTYARVHKVGHQRTLPVESPVITINNEKRKSDPTGIVPLPPHKRVPAPVPQIDDQNEPMDVDSPSPMAASDMVSPLQGFKVTVSNLHPAVTQDDIIELFASIGALKKARLVKKGNAEVVYVRKEDALAAVKRYHNRLLDNLPMNVKCVASAAQLNASTSSMTSASKSKESKTPVDLDIDIVHKALFKSKDQTTSKKPVQFLVKI